MTIQKSKNIWLISQYTGSLDYKRLKKEEKFL